MIKAQTSSQPQPTQQSCPWGDSDPLDISYKWRSPRSLQHPILDRLSSLLTRRHESLLILQPLPWPAPLRMPFGPLVLSTKRHPSHFPVWAAIHLLSCLQLLYLRAPRAISTKQWQRLIRLHRFPRPVKFPQEAFADPVYTPPFRPAHEALLCPSFYPPISAPSSLRLLLSTAPPVSRPRAVTEAWDPPLDTEPTRRPPLPVYLALGRPSRFYMLQTGPPPPSRSSPRTPLRKPR